MASLGGLPAAKGISTTASTLITSARSSGTRKNYQSAWGKFTRWCCKREVDPFSCDIKHILDYLGALFVDKKECSCIGTHRSAISAYHTPVEGLPVGKHPLVRLLMKGASNERPALPKYRYIWEVELVIKKFCSMPDNEALTLEQLGYKLITLLGLCSIKRCGVLAALSTKWMSHFSDRTVCAFGIKSKTSKKRLAKPVTFYRFLDNPKLCPATTLKHYVDRTNTFRMGNSYLHVFVSFRKPHKPVTRPTLTKWVLKMLTHAGIDTGKFKAHSMRSAASSKVSSLGMQLKEVLENGNWSRESTWQRFYHKEIESSERQFQNTLLSRK